MAGKENLKTPSTEEARERGRKGGIKSGKVRKERKKLKEELEALLMLKDESGSTNQERMSLSLIKEALLGNTKAFEVIRDTIGENPKQKIEHSGAIKLEDIL